MVLEERGMQRLSACKGALQRKGDGGGGNQKWLRRQLMAAPPGTWPAGFGQYYFPRILYTIYDT